MCGAGNAAESATAQVAGECLWACRATGIEVRGGFGEKMQTHKPRRDRQGSQACSHAACRCGAEGSHGQLADTAAPAKASCLPCLADLHSLIMP